MSRYIYEVELTPDKEESDIWNVTVPDLPGCYTFGEGMEEAMIQAVDAMKTFVASLIRHNDVVPQPTFGNEPSEGGRVIAVSFDTDADYIVNAVTPSEAAEMLSVSRGRISQMIKAGLLNAQKSGTETWVDVASINDRLASPGRAGRPRKAAYQI
ncbi:MAG: type II toxin-antitoxin system HicB family antitoxin [Coriobacteriales bacterium]|jgi:excisionase family DNA binding protein|nr:type II toxin-antitoxin system HicB family antitoxin [Coriobacteriales bacterium]